mgnify:CR=1 FL=1
MVEVCNLDPMHLKHINKHKKKSEIVGKSKYLKRIMMNNKNTKYDECNTSRSQTSTIGVGLKTLAM